jgi:hypothetical protein
MIIIKIITVVGIRPQYDRPAPISLLFPPNDVDVTSGSFTLKLTNPKP